MSNETIINGIKIVNLTPHMINYNDGSLEFSVPSAGYSLRLEQKIEESGNWNGIRVVSTTFGTPTFVNNDKTPNSMTWHEFVHSTDADVLIVSALAASGLPVGELYAIHDISVATPGDTVLNDKGHVLYCRALNVIL